jgi:hypothetical protein
MIVRRRIESVNREVRILTAILCGFTVGLALGPIIPMMAIASDTLVRGWPLPDMEEVKSKDTLLKLLLISIPAGINSAIGAGLAAARGNRRRLVISVFPIGLHVVAGIWAMVASPSEFLLLQLLALLFTVVVWPAGRLGQMIGWALRNRKPEMEASNQYQQLTDNAKDGVS